MLSGFWVELPLMAAFLFKPFKPKSDAEWAKVSEWTVKVVLPATLTGVIYGFTKPERDRAKAQALLESTQLCDASHGSIKSWVAAEKTREQEDSHLSL